MMTNAKKKLTFVFSTVTLLCSSLFLSTTQAASVYNQLDRNAFNRLAQETNTPLFWRKDEKNNNTIEPEQVSFLWGMRPDQTIADYVNQHQFTASFDEVYRRMVNIGSHQPPDPDKITDPEQKRRALVIQEIGQARPALLMSDFTRSSAEDQAVVKHVLKMASLIDEIYLMQNGVYALDKSIPNDDTASRTLFFRNHGPFCLNPKTEDNPDCNALPSKPKRVVGVYPASLQQTKNFCEILLNHKDSKNLVDSFATVIEQNGKWLTVPYATAYQPKMLEVANELDATAASIHDAKETAFKNYLLAAAKSFRNNDWYAADEAWAKMNATNSKWYLRIGPDEVYWEPCSLKAAFHVSFAKINPESILWQEKLNPLKDEMEAKLASLAGPPYQARQIKFHLPDFIDIILNAGDSRSHAGGTMGQSLPNTGPVAEKGLGRTVVMTNIIMPDETSRSLYLKRAASLFCKATMDKVAADPKLTNMTTVLHEAAHNLGPAHEYKVNGKVDRDVFGGPMASMLEELKAQSSALYFTGWLVEKKIIDQATADQAGLDNLLWAFGHISRGMYTADGGFKAYSQLAAIQFGTLVKGGSVVWHREEKAANGADQGCFEVDMNQFRTNVLQLEQTILQIKARGDRAKAESWKSEMVDNDPELKRLHAIITERVLRSPALTFVYAVKD